MSDIVFRKGIRVMLRPLERADVPALRRWVNDPDVTQYLARSTPAMEKEEEEWIDRLSSDRANYVFGMVVLEDKRLIGTIGLHRIDWRNRTAATGTMIGEKDCWGKGYGTEAKMLLLDFAFNALDLYAIESGALATNERSIAYSKRCGYVEVGRVPRWHRRSDGTRCDDVWLVAYQDAWRPLWEEYAQQRDAALSQE